MKKFLGSVYLVGLLSNVALGQAAPGPAAFSVASVKPHGPFTGGADVTREDDGGLTYVDITLARLLMRAYNMKIYQLAGPSWLTTEFYDVAAKMPADGNRSQIPAMLQCLLAERFHAEVHREMREISGYALRIDANGLKLKECKEESCPPNRLMHQPRTGADHLQARTLSALADQLTGVVGKPVVDMTGVGQTFSIQLDVQETASLSSAAPAAAPPPKERVIVDGQPVTVGGDLPSAEGALKPLGLVLHAERVKVEHLVIDKLDKVPTAN